MNYLDKNKKKYIIVVLVCTVTFLITYFFFSQVLALLILTSAALSYSFGLRIGLLVLSLYTSGVFLFLDYGKIRYIPAMITGLILVYFSSKFKTLKDKLEASLKRVGESEERFRIKFKNSPTPIFTWEKVGNDFELVDFNTAAEQLTKNKIEVLLNRKASEVYAHHPDVLRHMNTAFNKKGTVREEGAFTLITTQEEKYLDTSFVFVPPNFVLIHTVDITERHNTKKELEQKVTELNEAKEEAERANAAKDRFLSIVSHELKTPLASILGYANMLLEMDLSDEEKKQAIRVIERNAKTQSNLINDLLDVSRFLTGRMKIKELIIGITGIISQVYESFRPIALAKDITVNIQVKNSNIFVKGDPEKVKQIFMNVVDNAIKFTPKGGQVDLIVDNDDQNVKVEIRDTGVGIAKEQLSHLFKIFYQEDNFAVTRRFQGLGLGLYIVKNLLDLHKGTIKIESEKNKGTQVYITLPRTASPISEQGIIKQEKKNSTSQNILIIEDDDVTREMLVFAFQKIGFSVLQADSAEAAKTIISDNHFDVIVSDIGLPVQSGLELMAELRDEGLTTPSLALTAFEGSQYDIEAKKNGFNAYLSKPVDLKLLIKTVKDLI